MKLHAEKHPEKYRQVIHNRGFAGEYFRNRPGIVRLVSAVLTVFGISVVFMLPDDSTPEKIRKAGWTVMTAGGLSNTLDRLIRRYVVDYIPKGKYVYNLGDFAIFAGTLGFMAGTLMERE